MFAAIAVGTLIAGNLPTAHATLMVKFVQGANTLTVTDNLAGDSNFAPNIINFSGAVGNFTLVVTLAKTFNTLGIAGLDLISSTITSLGTVSSIDLILTDTDYLLNDPSAAGALTTTLQEPLGVTDGTVTMRSFFDAGNTAFAETTLLSALVSNPDTELLQPFGVGLVTAPFALTLRINVSHPGVGALTEKTDLHSSVELVTNPEPGTMILLITGLAGIAGFGYSRGRQQQA